MPGIRNLITCAFGKTACLYKDVLHCSSLASSSELRKAYHKRALCFHPDKQQHRQGNEDYEAHIKKSTLCFQAVSAAYELLSDSEKRAVYDATKMMGDDDTDDDNDASSSSTVKGNKDWVRFFRSVFQELFAAGDNFDREEYCSSDQERADVLKYYKLCKGDFQKILSCIVLGEESDIKRWRDDIIEPAIRKGLVEKYCSESRSLDKKQRSKESKKIKKLIKKTMNVACPKPVPSFAVDSKQASLEDTDDDDDESSRAKVNRKAMSRRDKLEYRVAKKRKEKQERDIDFANIIQSKQWSVNYSTAKQKRKRTNSTFSDSFLSSLESKFSDDKGKNRGASKTKKKKRKFGP